MVYLTDFKDILKTVPNDCVLIEADYECRPTTYDKPR